MGGSGGGGGRGEGQKVGGRAETMGACVFSSWVRDSDRPSVNIGIREKRFQVSPSFWLWHTGESTASGALVHGLLHSFRAVATLVDTAAAVGFSACISAS